MKGCLCRIGGRKAKSKVEFKIMRKGHVKKVYECECEKQCVYRTRCQSLSPELPYVTSLLLKATISLYNSDLIRKKREGWKKRAISPETSSMSSGLTLEVSYIVLSLSLLCVIVFLVSIVLTSNV